MARSRVSLRIGRAEGTVDALRDRAARCCLDVPASRQSAGGHPRRGFRDRAARDRRALGVAIRVALHAARGPLAAARRSTTSSTSAPCPSCSPTARASSRPFDFVFERRSTLPTAEHPPLYSRRARRAGPSSGCDSPDAQRLTGTRLRRGHDRGWSALLGRRLAGERAGLIAAGLAALYPTLIAADGALMSESLYGLLVGRVAAGRLPAAWTSPASAARSRSARSAAWRPSRAARRCCCFRCCWCRVLRRPAGLRAAAVAALALRRWCSPPGRCATGSVFDRPVLDRHQLRAARSAGANCDATYYGRQARRLAAASASESTPATRPSTMPRRCADGVRLRARPRRAACRVVLAARLGRVWSVYHPFQIPEGRSRARAEARRDRVLPAAAARRLRRARCCAAAGWRVGSCRAVRAWSPSRRCSPTATCASASPPSSRSWCLPRSPSTRSGAGGRDPRGGRFEPCWLAAIGLRRAIGARVACGRAHAHGGALAARLSSTTRPTTARSPT